MPACTACEREVEARFRFCPWCGLAQRRKIVEFFWPHANSPGRALRVSRYLGDERHVRFSVWEDGVARAAVSLDEEEAVRLGDFLHECNEVAEQPGRNSGDSSSQTL
jgi:hypothetical protein